MIIWAAAFQKTQRMWSKGDPLKLSFFLRKSHYSDVVNQIDEKPRYLGTLLK